MPRDLDIYIKITIYYTKDAGLANLFGIDRARQHLLSWKRGCGVLIVRKRVRAALSGPFGQ